MRAPESYYNKPEILKEEYSADDDSDNPDTPEILNPKRDSDDSGNPDDSDNPDIEENKENIRYRNYGASLVSDHFPDFTDKLEKPLEKEEDYEETFSAFKQEELVPVRDQKTDKYHFILQYRPYKETVSIYSHKTEALIKDLSGEDGKNPTTDVAIYLDKSARPVSWFVNEFWSSFSDKPRPRIEHLAVDRRPWFEEFGIKLTPGEYIEKGEGKKELAEWRDIPVHEVTTEQIAELRSLFENKIITAEDVEYSDDVWGYRLSAKGERAVTVRMVDILLDDNDANSKLSQRRITNEEYNELLNQSKKKAMQLVHRWSDKNVWEAFRIASQIRALFLADGITEEEMRRPDMIMNRESGMEGKNITIIDEVERTGTTREIATHFISWAFPEAASVRFHVFYKAKTLIAGHDHPQNGQMLMIPFWYPLSHDDGTGRGIAANDSNYYENNYKNIPNNINRAALYGSKFLGIPIDYNTEPGQKSLHFREQIWLLSEGKKEGLIK